jgi:hypothetical protein
MILGYYFHRKKLCVKFDEKNGLGYFLGDFFTKPSGRPDPVQTRSLNELE